MKISLLLLIALPLCAAVDNVRIAGATSTQAILAYTAPTGAACSVEVYDSSGMKAGGLAVTGASNTSPIEITTGYDHYLSTGDKVYIAGAGGNTNANGYSTVTVTGPKSFTLNGKVGNGTYTSGGAVAVLVHDVNTRLFGGADQDSRAGNIANGRDRTFVAGARAAAKALDGRWYSRALQAATLHAYRIVCGADSAAGAFQTTNIPLGNNYFGSWPVDPAAPNQVAYPTIDFTPVYSPGASPLSSSGTTVTSTAHGLVAGDNIALNSGPQLGEIREVAAVINANQVTLKSAFPASQTNQQWIKLDPTKESSAQTIIDPQSGILMRPMTAIRSAPQTVKPIRDAWDNGTAAHWTPSSGTLYDALSADDSNAASFTGGAGEQPWLSATSSWVVPGYDSGHTDVTDSQTSNMTGFYNPAYVVIALKGSASAAGANGSVDLCLSKNGVECFTRVVTQDLNQCGSGCQVGSIVPVLKFWEDPADPIKTQISRKDLYGRTGTGTVSGNTLTITNTSQYFNLNWTRGSRITLGSNPGASYVIDSVPNLKTLVLQNPPAAGSYGYTASNFSVLVRKTTPSPDTVTVQNISFSIGVYTTLGWYYGGVKACHDAKVTQTYNGVTREGYHCLVPRDSTYSLYFVGAENGDAAFLGVTSIAGGSRGSLSWSAGACIAAVPSWHATDPNKFYCIRDGVALEIEYTGDNLERHYEAYGLEATATPLNAGDKRIDTLVSDWVNANSPEAGTFKTSGCTDRGSPDGRYMGFMCLWGQTDSYGWAAVLDIAEGSPTRGQIVGARSSNGAYPFRYCGMHGNSSLFGIDDRIYSGVNVKSFTFSSSSCGMGPFKVDHAAIPSTGGSCPANWNDFDTGTTAYKSGGQPVCTDITITKEPYDPDPCSNASFDNGNSLPGELGYLPGQGLRVGDKLCVGGCLSSGDREFVQLLRNNGGGSWTVLRGLGGHAPTAWAGTDVMTATCPAEGAVQWWDVAADPTGTAGYSALYGLPQTHGAIRGNRRISEGYEIYEGTIPQMSSQFKSGIRRMAAYYVPFAGKTPNAGSDTHIALGQADAEANPWGLDFSPLYGNPAILPMPMASLGAAGALWRLTPDANHPALNRKYSPTAPSCGNRALIDVSGPNSKMDEGPAYAHRYCAIEYDAATECTKADGTPWAGASVGQVVLNCPSVTVAAQCGNNGYADGVNDSIRPCLADSGPRYETTYQVGLGPVGGPNDNAGRWSRTLGRHMTLPQRAYNPYANTTALPDGSWALAFTPGAGGTQNLMIGLKLPPYPAKGASENLATFVPIEPEVKSVPPLTDNVVAEFGYDPQFRCTTRQEACVSVTGGSSPQGVNEKAPFFWAGEAYTGISCTAGCHVTIPAIPQRVVYYRLKYRAADGTVIAAGKTETAVSGAWE